MSTINFQISLPTELWGAIIAAAEQMNVVWKKFHFNSQFSSSTVDAAIEGNNHIIRQFTTNSHSLRIFLFPSFVFLCLDASKSVSNFFFAFSSQFLCFSAFIAHEQNTTTRTTTAAKLDHRTSLKSFMTKMKRMLKAEFGKLGRKRSNQTKINCLAVLDSFQRFFVAARRTQLRPFGTQSVWSQVIEHRKCQPQKAKWKSTAPMICVVERIFPMSRNNSFNFSCVRVAVERSITRSSFQPTSRLTSNVLGLMHIFLIARWWWGEDKNKTKNVSL